MRVNDILKDTGKIQLGIFALLVLSLPFNAKLSSIAMVLALILSLYQIFILKRVSWSLDGFTLSLIAYFLIEVLGLLYTDKINLGIGFFSLEKHIGFILFPLIFMRVDLSHENRKLLMWMFIWSCLVASIYCVVVNMFESLEHNNTLFHEWRFSHDRVSEPIGMQAVYFAMYLSLGVLAMINFFMSETLTRFKKILMLLLLGYFIFIIVALGARTVTVSLILVSILNIVMYALLEKAYRFLLIAAFLPVLFIGFIILNPVVYTRFMDLRHNQTEGSNYDSYFARTKIWNPGLEAIKEHLVFGVGTGDHQTELNKKYEKYNYKDAIEIELNMHNQYFQTALSFGLIGLCIFLGVLFVPFREALMRRDLLYGSFLLLFAMACLTESLLSRNKGIIFFLVFGFIFHKSKK